MSDQRWVEIAFDCVPLRSVVGLQVPDDASPGLTKKIERIQQALQVHGTVNTYFLHNAACCYHLTNDSSLGMVQFGFEGTVFTDRQDEHAVKAELRIQLERENCDWLHQGIVHWLGQSVQRAVLVEFDRYIAAGDLQRTRDRIAEMERSLDSQYGFLGMHL
jgi:hypothetical protein